MTDLVKLIKQKLSDELIISFNEPIISLIQVQNPKKRKEDYANKLHYLLATINNDNNSTPIVHLLKIIKGDKFEIKLKSTWRLNQIKLIKLLNDDQQQNKFEFLFDFDKTTKYEWKCETSENCIEFLTALWKLSEQFLIEASRPKFVNFQKPEHAGKHMNTIAAHLFAPTSHDSKTMDSNGGFDIDEIIPEIDINRKDEDALLKLFAECDYATTNVDRFVEKLQAELVNLETSNVEGIMNSEENTIKLIAMLDKAVDEIEKIDQRLQIYEDKISAVGDAVKKVGNEDNFIQIQENNQKNLLSVLENMIRQLDLSDEHSDLLKSKIDFSNRVKIDRSIQAANALLKALDSSVPDGLTKMKAFEEQKRQLENLKQKFSTESAFYLKNVITHSFNEHSGSYNLVDNSLNALPSHKTIFDKLVVFKEIVPWLYKAYPPAEEVKKRDEKNSSSYDPYGEVKKGYIEAAQAAYTNEVIPFCACARATILKQDRPKASAVASMENIKNQIQKSLDKGHSGDIFSIKIDQQTKDILKSCFRKLLKQLSESVQVEENFCHEFFNVKSSGAAALNGTVKNLQQDSVPNSPGLSTPSAAKMSDQTKNDLAILKTIFNNLIEEQVKIIIESIQKLEPMMIIFIYSELLYHVLVSFNNKHYMHQPLVWLLRLSKEKCDEYTNDFKEAIKEYKVNKRERIGIIKYIIYFEEFVREAELCWEPIKKDMYEKLCMIYQIVVNEIVQGIEAIAHDSQKTPPDVVRFQNYHQLNRKFESQYLVSGLPHFRCLDVMRSINGLKESTKYAKDQFNLCKQSYIKEHFGRPLEKLHFFFEKVEQRVERGVKYEDISYQMDLSLNNLREIIREYPGKEVKRGLENLYRKVEKHLGENNGLLQVIWRDMTEEFIRQYKNYENLIRLCYPGQKISLEFTADEVTQYFAEIAQSH